MEGYLTVGRARLYYRQVGAGHPIVVLHGGPDLDHNYLRPEMDRLGDSFRLIYYDQRGRGRSAEGADPEEVDMQSEMEDLDSLRRHLGLDSFALLGHSWGGLLALEYAIRHPAQVSHLILMNTAPVSHDGRLLLSRYFAEIRPTAVSEAMTALASTDRYRSGDLDADAEYNRLHFQAALPRPEHLELVLARLRANFTEEGVRKARAIGDRLYERTWNLAEYDLLPALAELEIPTLVLHGDRDFISIEVAAQIAEAIGGLLEVLPGCGHFAYLEFPYQVQTQIRSLLSG